MSMVEKWHNGGWLIEDVQDLGLCGRASRFIALRKGNVVLQAPTEQDMLNQS